MTSPARNRRENQPVPSTQSDAGARFKCEAYLCTMSGQTCRDYHANAMEFRPENRDACIDCPAGAARLMLLGRNGSAGQTAICTARTARGTLCCHPPVEGGLCHIHRGAAASKTRQAIAAGQETRMKKKTAAAPVKSPAKSAASPKKRPWMVKSGAHGIAQTSAAPTCARAGCDRPTVSGTALSEYCRECVNTAYTSLRKVSGRTPTNAERAEWLASHPTMVKYRRRGAEATAPGEVVIPEVLPVPDVHVAVSPEAVDEVVAREVDAVATVVESEMRVPRHNARLEIGERLCKLLDVKTPPAFDLFPVGERAWGCKIDPADPVSILHPEGDFQFNTTCWRPAAGPRGGAKPETVASVVEVVAEPEMGGDNNGRAEPARLPRLPGEAEASRARAEETLVEVERCLAASVLITIPLNRRAYAELERMAAAGLHGDDPCDAARTLILDGLRRWALVRL